MTIKDWTEQWLNSYKKNKVKDQTLYAIKNLVNKHFINLIGDIEIEKITNIDLQNLMNNLEYMGNSKNKLKFYIQAIFQKAYENKIIKENPAIMKCTPKVGHN